MIYTYTTTYTYIYTYMIGFGTISYNVVFLFDSHQISPVIPMNFFGKMIQELRAFLEIPSFIG